MIRAQSSPPECHGQLDFVAFDYYFGTQFLGCTERLIDVLNRRYDHAPIWAGGLYDALRYFQGMFPDKPVFVIENGFAGPPHAPGRARYVRDHVRQIQHARQDGVDVIGYPAWSLTTNREWGLPVISACTTSTSTATRASPAARLPPRRPTPRSSASA